MDIRFHVPFTGRVDRENHIIRGVSLITGDLEAEGHDLHVDDTTLKQIHNFAGQRKKVTVKADHKGADGKTFKDIVGHLENFSTDTTGKKVRGDLHLLASDPLTPKIEEMAETMPENFGLSVAFKGAGAKVAGKKFARCEKLLSVDLVENPAANPDGLFSSRVDTGKNGMAENTNAEPTLSDIAKLITTQGEQIAGFNQRLEAIEAAGNKAEPNPNLTLEDALAMTDEELAEHGYERADIDAALAKVESDGTADIEAGNQPGGGTPTAAEAAVAPVASALAALRLEVIQLSAKEERKDREAQEASVIHAFEVIDAKVTALAAKNEELVQLTAKLTAENNALRVAVRTGSRTVPGANVESESHNFAKKEGTFENLFSAKVADLVKGGKTDREARADAVSLCIKENEGAYHEWQARGGKLPSTIQFSAK